jgi:hypothetical protein
VFTVLRTLRAIHHEDELDEAWLQGMEKEDIQCVRVGDGWQIKGFNGIDLGTKFTIFLRSVSVPRDADDTRTAAQRRIDGFDDLLTRALAEGLPAEGSVKPHISVVVDAEKLKNTLNGNQTNIDLDTQPAILEGFGPIGPALLTYLLHGSDLTPILVSGFTENLKILDVGRSKRVATNRQRRAIRLRQQGRCANRGCHHPIGEVHHILDWIYGGTTNLDNLVGLCRTCHALITMRRLFMTGTHETGYTFTTSRAGPLARTG